MGNRIGRRSGLLSVLAAAVVVAGVAATPAMGQGPGGGVAERVLPPTPRRAPTPPTLWNYFVLLVVGGAIFGANLIPSKRGHQD